MRKLFNIFIKNWFVSFFFIVFLFNGNFNHFRLVLHVFFLSAGLCGQSLVTLLSNAQFDTLALWQGDVSLGALSDDENISQTGGEHVTVGVFHVDDLERSWMFLAVHDGTDATQISTSGDHDQIS